MPRVKDLTAEELKTIISEIVQGTMQDIVDAMGARFNGEYLQGKEFKIERPKRAKLTVKDSLKRMQEFEKRKEKFIATVRKDEDRSLHTRFTEPSVS